jgi:predicted permease
MPVASRLRHLWGRLFHRDREERDLDEEVQSFFDMRMDRRMAQGASRQEAQRAERLSSGDAGRVKENVREARVGFAIETTGQDVRYGLRVLRKNPGFAIAAILSLGLGLGANTAIFTLVDTVMLKPLPVRDPERLVFVDNSGGKSGGTSGPPYPCFERLRDNNHYFSGMAAFSGDRFKVTIDGAQEKFNGQYASGNYFQLLGVDAALGRVLTPADDSVAGSGGPDGGVAVISYGFWSRRFGRNPAVIGKSIQVGTTQVAIVGVTRPGFSGLVTGSPVDVTIPMALTTNNLRGKTNWWFSVVGRLKDGAAVEPARAELDRMFHAYMEEVGIRSDKYFTGIALVSAARGPERLRRRFSKPLLIVMTIVGLLLLIGCANVANLLMARASARRHEIAMRLAIGAGQGRIVRQLVTEGLLLVSAAAVAGVLLAKWGVAVLVAFLAGIRGQVVLEPQFDLRVAGFTAAVALITGLLFSVAPALHAVRADAAKPSRGGTRTGNTLVVLQIMLSVVLLCGCALFLRTLQNLTTLDAGFQREGVITIPAEATLPRPNGPSRSSVAEEEHGRIGRMWESVLQAVSDVPSVRAASVSSLSPLSGRDRGILMDVSGAPAGRLDRGIHINQVSAGYFETFGIGLLAGRVFGPGDQANSPKAAILNETAVRLRFHDSNPVGRRVNFGGQRVTADYEVVGVVRDVRYENLRKPDEPMVYVPIQQAIDPLSGVMLGIRNRGDSAGIVTALRRRVQAVVPGGFLGGVVTVQQLVEENLLEERLVSILATLFGGVALLLAAVGLHGILSFTVIRRTREIGIRIAVGAQRTAVIWLILRSTLRLVGIGVALGMPLVLLTKRYIASQLYGVEGTDPAALAGATLLLIGVILTAGFWPAWRASRVDPTVSLRQD